MFYDIKDDISTIIQIIKTNLRSSYSKNEIQNTVINIVGGLCFSRGISVVSRDYEWHITGEIFLPGKTTDVGNIMQGLRVCRNFEDNINLKLWTTKDVLNHIKAYDLLQKDLLSKMSINNYSVSEALELMVAFEDKFEEHGFKMTRSLGRGSDGKSVKVQYTEVKKSQVHIDGTNKEQRNKIKILANNDIKMRRSDINGILNTKGKVTKISKK